MADEQPLEPASPPTPPSPQKKRNGWLWGCLGCGGVTVVLLIALGFLGAILGGDEERGETALAAVETRTFDSSEVRGEDPAENPVPFSFSYPTTWESANDARDLVQVVRRQEGALAEAFRVGYFTADPAAVRDPALLGPMLEKSREQLAGAFANFRPVRTGPVTVGGHPGVELTFSANPQAGQELWGRLILLPGNDGRGLSLLLLATPAAESVEGPAHVGERGELPVILKSFNMAQR